MWHALWYMGKQYVEGLGMEPQDALHVPGLGGVVCGEAQANEEQG